MTVLLLGGTTEASAFARLLAQARVPAIFSYAGRTATPVRQPIPVRAGGFGGADGLAAFLRAEGIARVVDATHPFAAQISANAAAACEAAGVPLLALERPGWTEGAGDHWRRVPDTAAAAAALPRDPTRVFLALGRQSLPAFACLPHHWLMRVLEADPVPLPGTVIVGRGPFSLADEGATLRAHGIEWLVTKNSGGDRAKLDAARAEGVRVVMIDRPAMPRRLAVQRPEAALAWVHGADLGV